MLRFFSVLLWSVVFLLLLAGIDQLLVRVPASHPAHLAITTFYRDLRSRVVELAAGGKPSPAPAAAPAKEAAGKTAPPASIESLIEQRQSRPDPKPPAAASPPPPKDKAAARSPGMRYVYADDRREIHFAETLAEIPEPYRGKAKLLGE